MVNIFLPAEDRRGHIYFNSETFTFQHFVTVVDLRSDFYALFGITRSKFNIKCILSRPNANARKVDRLVKVECLF